MKRFFLFCIYFLITTFLYSQNIDIKDSSVIIGNSQLVFNKKGNDTNSTAIFFTNAFGENYKAVYLKRENKTFIIYKKKGIILECFGKLSKNKIKPTRIAAMYISFQDTTNSAKDLYLTCNFSVMHFKNNLTIENTTINDKSNFDEIYNSNTFHNFIDTIHFKEIKLIKDLIPIDKSIFSYFIKFRNERLYLIQIGFSNWYIRKNE